MQTATKSEQERRFVVGMAREKHVVAAAMLLVSND
jgi:hypothetical protein